MYNILRYSMYNVTTIVAYQLGGQFAKEVDQLLSVEWLTRLTLRWTPVFEQRTDSRVVKHLFDKALLT